MTIEITCHRHNTRMDVYADGDGFAVVEPCPRCYYRVSDSASMAERMTAVAHELQDMANAMDADPMRMGLACEIRTGLMQIDKWVSELGYLEAI
jgi:hypothetical protein